MKEVGNAFVAFFVSFNGGDSNTSFPIVGIVGECVRGKEKEDQRESVSPNTTADPSDALDRNDDSPASFPQFCIQIRSIPVASSSLRTIHGLGRALRTAVWLVGLRRDALTIVLLLLFIIIFLVVVVVKVGGRTFVACRVAGYVGRRADTSDSGCEERGRDECLPRQREL